MNQTTIGRVKFVYTHIRTKAIQLYPWAQYTLHTSNGYYCFEMYEDYAALKEKLKDGNT